MATRDNQMSSALITAVAFTLAAAVLVPFALISGSLQFDLAPGIWLLALYMGAGPTALAYFLIQVALRSTTATAAAVVTLLEPAVAALLAWLLLGERMSLLTIGGAILLAGSVWLLAWRRSPSSM